MEVNLRTKQNYELVKRHYYIWIRAIPIIFEIQIENKEL